MEACWLNCSYSCISIFFFQTLQVFVSWSEAVYVILDTILMLFFVIFLLFQFSFFRPYYCQSADFYSFPPIIMKFADWFYMF